MAGSKKAAAKAVKTMKEKYGEDYFSKIAKHGNNPYKGNSEHMTALVNARWEKYRREIENNKNTGKGGDKAQTSKSQSD